MDQVERFNKKKEINKPLRWKLTARYKNYYKTKRGPKLADEEEKCYRNDL